MKLFTCVLSWCVRAQSFRFHNLQHKNEPKKPSQWYKGRKRSILGGDAYNYMLYVRECSVCGAFDTFFFRWDDLGYCEMSIG